MYSTRRGDPKTWDSGPVGDKIQEHPFSLSHCTLDVSTKAAARAMGLGLRAAVSKLHLREVHSPRRCEETQLN